MTPDLLEAITNLYTPHNLICSNIVRDAESAEYSAYTFNLNSFSVIFRVAKITPKKVGQFVTFWKKMDGGPIQPFDITDPLDFFIISLRNADHFGQFIFPKSILLKMDILSKDGKGGKRAIRVYPPWDKTESAQAQKTQKWQLTYFFDKTTFSKDILKDC